MGSQGRWLVFVLMVALVLGCSKPAAEMPKGPPASEQGATGQQDSAKAPTGTQQPAATDQPGSAKPSVDTKPSGTAQGDGAGQSSSTGQGSSMGDGYTTGGYSTGEGYSTGQSSSTGQGSQSGQEQTTAQPNTTPPPDQSAAAQVPAAEAPASQPAGASSSAQRKRFVVVAAESEATYIAQETFAGVSLPAEAIGVTKEITGELILSANGLLEPTTVTVDLRKLMSNSGSRDSMIRARYLESNTYPFAVFTIGSIQGAPPAWVENQEVAFQLNGKLTVRNVERETIWNATAIRTGDRLKLTAEVALQMTDFGISPPDLVGVLKVENDMRLRVSLVAKQE